MHVRIHTFLSSSSRSHLVVWSLRQTQFSSSQFCHGLHRSDGSHVSVDTVRPSLLRSSSPYSPGWYHLQSLSSNVVLGSSLHVSKPPQFCCLTPLCDILYIHTHVYYVDMSYFMLYFVGKGKGTPFIRVGIHCTGIDIDEESEGSDWPGFHG